MDAVGDGGLADPEAVVSYWRWYSNNSGANPGADWWQVQISNTNGSKWVPVEKTKDSDRSWRRQAVPIERGGLKKI